MYVYFCCKQLLRYICLAEYITCESEVLICLVFLSHNSFLMLQTMNAKIDHNLTKEDFKKPIPVQNGNSLSYREQLPPPHRHQHRQHRPEQEHHLYLHRHHHCPDRAKKLYVPPSGPSSQFKSTCVITTLLTSQCKLRICKNLLMEQTKEGKQDLSYP